MAKMQYRRLGGSGLQISLLSFGSWVTFDNQLGDDLATECMQTAFERGCNFFDNAEAYAGGGSEAQMGRVLQQLGWERHEFVVSSKFYWGIHGNVRNMRNTLNRKYLMQAIDHSLERMQLDFLDLAFCHRPDPNTPLEETVWAMSDMITQGKVLYWGTSEWSADDIRAAWDIADRHHLHKPVMEQPQYNLFARDKVEIELAPLYDEIGLGTTIWSPLAGGLLTGKYGSGVPKDSRGALAGYEWFGDRVTDAHALRKVEALRPIAKELDCTLAQLAIAWCASNPRVSTVITGASRPGQVVENFAALDVVDRITPEVKARIEAATA